MSVLLYFIYFFFLWLHLWHMEFSRLDLESEIQLHAYTTAIAILDPSCICGLHHNLWQCWILNPLSKARDLTHILRPLTGWGTMRIPQWHFKKINILSTMCSVLKSLCTSWEIWLTLCYMGLYLGSWRNTFILQQTYLVLAILILTQTFTIIPNLKCSLYTLSLPLSILICNQHLGFKQKQLTVLGL